MANVHNRVPGGTAISMKGGLTSVGQIHEDGRGAGLDDGLGRRRRAWWVKKSRSATRDYKLYMA